tara:strand:+ start:5125 stop:5775 length:651 start_codon:yes stop_codon:yes gene_type:complete
MYKIYEQPFDLKKLEDNVVIIDVLRAATVAAVVSIKKPLKYYMTADEKKIRDLYNKNITSVTIGKSTKDKSFFYSYVNSPSQIWNVDLKDKVVLHRSRACGGMLDKLKDKNVIICGFCNIQAVSDYIKDSDKDWDIVCCGFNGEEPNDEDKYCAELLADSVEGDQNQIYRKLEKSDSVICFTENKLEYPKKDKDICLTLNLISFAIRAKENVITIL